MTVLVTGGAGYIGSHMVHALADAGERVVVLDNLSTGFDWAVPQEAKLVVGDIGDGALVGSIVRDHAVDAIIHFAGSIVVPESVADPLGLSAVAVFSSGFLDLQPATRVTSKTAVHVLRMAPGTWRSCPCRPKV